jgi:hypothetical protein
MSILALALGLFAGEYMIGNPTDTGTEYEVPVNGLYDNN